MPTTLSDVSKQAPIAASYWVVPGRLLAGEYPAAPSREASLERLREFLLAGVTCFIDLTEPEELSSYEGLLPFSTPSGRRVEYLRLPITDHGIPRSPEEMTWMVGVLEDALQAGHVVYVHCRAGIGRTSTLVACWLASRNGGDTGRALDELQLLWQQASQSRAWPRVPETDEQFEFVRTWHPSSEPRPLGPAPVMEAAAGRAERIRGGLLGLGLGDALGAAPAARRAAGLAFTQHSALALCLASSLLELGRFDARDQLARYLRWLREGYCSANGTPGVASPDVARALGSAMWRGGTMSGSHDPRDRSTASLSRAVVAALYAARDPAAAVAMAAESSRPTHQAPVIVDACRCLAAMVVCAVQGRPPGEVLTGRCEPAPGMWSARPLRAELAGLDDPAQAVAEPRADPSLDVIAALARARQAVLGARDFETAVRRAGEGTSEPSAVTALAGALFGALHGVAAIPAERLAALAGIELLEQTASDLAGHDAPQVE
ncbi:MAG TPA: ADP-ribosylglycohydrolase family protein [Steroidobacteraceae bacterium]|nr:ADP-ribosylglycohydrolase family protein [Steroidobacteraceae bacterium]